MHLHIIFLSAIAVMQEIFWTEDNFYFTSDCRNLFNCKLKGVVILNARYQGGRKLPRVWKLEQLGSRGMKSIGCPRTGYKNSVNNSFKRPRGAKTAGQFFTGYETFQAKFEEFNFQGVYDYAYILKYFC